MADEKEEVDNPDVHFAPLVTLSPVETKTLEEDEDELVKLRAKLFRYDALCEPPQWKERGVGDIKIMRHRHKNTCRILMRRDKTLKMCANHFVLPEMELKPNCGSDRAWVWLTQADYADEEARTELLAVRFANAENAQKFKQKFDECRNELKTGPTGEEKGDRSKDSDKEEAVGGGEARDDGSETSSDSGTEVDTVTADLEGLSVKEGGSSTGGVKEGASGTGGVKEGASGTGGVKEGGSSKEEEPSGEQATSADEGKEPATREQADR